MIQAPTPMLYRFLLFVLALFTSAVGVAQSLPKTPTMKLVQVPVTPPGSGARPVEVRAGVFIDEISNVDEGRNAFLLNGALDLRWHDDRLAFDPVANGAKVKVYLEQDAEQMLEKIWWPTVRFVNQTSKPETQNEELMVNARGDVIFREKVRVSLDSVFNMLKFPFDRQRLRIRLASFAYRSDELTFRVDKEVVGLSPDFRLSGWEIGGIEEKVFQRKDFRDRAAFSEIEADISISRDSGFFVTKFLVPLVIVMILISAVLWIPPHDVKDRISATLTGMLTSAAYGFTITSYLPAHVYNTYLDSIVILALFHSSMLMVENVVSFRYADNQELEKSKRLDRISRWVFPIVFLLGTVILARIYGVV